MRTDWLTLPGGRHYPPYPRFVSKSLISTVMRRITVVRMKKLVAKFKSLCVEYLDCTIITILLLNLKHYYVYYKTIMPASNTNEWWNWPVYSGWSILGKVWTTPYGPPIYNDNNGSSDVTQFHYPKPHFVKYLPRMNQVTTTIFRKSTNPGLHSKWSSFVPRRDKLRLYKYNKKTKVSITILYHSLILRTKFIF